MRRQQDLAAEVINANSGSIEEDNSKDGIVNRRRMVVLHGVGKAK
jgi:hypothetical protein